jgi:flagellar export protein FliJ
MKAFRFTLAKILELRGREEESIRTDLAARTALSDEARRRVEARRVRLGVLLDAARGARGTGHRIDPAELAAADAAVAKARVVLAEGERELAVAEGERESCRLALVEAGRKRRALELLRERREAEWKARGAKDEQRALDELSAVQD